MSKEEARIISEGGSHYEIAVNLSNLYLSLIPQTPSPFPTTPKGD